MSTVEAKAAKKERRSYSGREKSQAVLALWTGRRRPAEVCKELSIPWGLLAQWQNRALEGMLEALEPRTRAAADRGPLLDDRLTKLLDRRVLLREGKLAKLSQRLARLQTPERKPVEKPA